MYSVSLFGVTTRLPPAPSSRRAWMKVLTQRFVVAGSASTKRPCASRRGAVAARIRAISHSGYR